VPLRLRRQARHGLTTVTSKNAKMGGLKPGVGVVFDLGKAVPVSAVELLLVGSGTTVDLRSRPSPRASCWSTFAAAVAGNNRYRAASQRSRCAHDDPGHRSARQRSAAVGPAGLGATRRGPAQHLRAGAAPDGTPGQHLPVAAAGARVRGHLRRRGHARPAERPEREGAGRTAPAGTLGGVRDPHVVEGRLRPPGRRRRADGVLGQGTEVRAGEVTRRLRSPGASPDFR
jgi:hypothetical protein